MLVLIKLNEMYNEYEGREVGNKLTVMRYKITKIGNELKGFCMFNKFFFYRIQF